MSWIAITICYVGTTALLGLITIIIKSGLLKSLKKFFFLLLTINTFLLGMLPYFISSYPNDTTTFKGIAESYLIVNGFALMTFIFFYGLQLIRKGIDGKNE